MVNIGLKYGEHDDMEFYDIYEEKKLYLQI